MDEAKTMPANFEGYKNLTPQIYRKARKLAKPLKGKRILHINSTPVGGGVAEMLKSQVPLENSLGLNSKWFFIRAPDKFFAITKKIHNLLQGKKDDLSPEEKRAYLNFIKDITPGFKKLVNSFRPDILIINDPQPLPLISSLPYSMPSILRLHIDLSTPSKSTLNFLKKNIEKYDSVVVSDPVYRPEWLLRKKTSVIMPAIDPFAEKNKPMEKLTAAAILQNFGISALRPSIAQISRFDKWKDPLGVIKAYYIAKNSVPDLQLILVGFMQAKDDPEAVELFQAVKKHAQGDPCIFLFSDPKVLKETTNGAFVSAVQTASRVVLQKSIREGFGLTVTEAMWKGKAVIGGKTRGISLQIKNGENGFLVSSPEEAGKILVKLLNNPKLRQKTGHEARKTVKKKFLMSRAVLEHLELYHQLLEQKR